jgi:basic amino acid/polyamine antiporter, APA family
VFVLRRRMPAPRPFRTPGYPWVPGVFIAGTTLGLAAIVWGEVRQPVPNFSPIIGLLIAAAGFPVYAVWRIAGGPRHRASAAGPG